MRPGCNRAPEAGGAGLTGYLGRQGAGSFPALTDDHDNGPVSNVQLEAVDLSVYLDSTICHLILENALCSAPPWTAIRNCIIMLVFPL